MNKRKQEIADKILEHFGYINDEDIAYEMRRANLTDLLASLGLGLPRDIIEPENPYLRRNGAEFYAQGFTYALRGIKKLNPKGFIALSDLK